MKFKSDIETQAGLVDSFGFTGAPGQVLSSTGNKTEWITPPQSPGGGGSSQVFYFNGGTASSVGGYYQMSPVANTGAAADFTINANGYIASFLTDVASPNQLNIPAGNWNFEVYFRASSNGGSPSFYVELYKYSSGGVFTLIASGSASPEGITNGTAIDAYFTPLSVPATTLLATDRLAVRVYVTHSGRTITMYTQNGHLSEVITTFSTGLTALNGLTEQVQYFTVGSGGTDFNIASATNTHTFNLPTASATNRGALSSANWTTFNDKQNALNGTGFVKVSGTTVSYDNSTYVPTSRTLTINGSTQDLSANRTFNIDTGVTSFNTRTGAVTLTSSDVTTALGYTPVPPTRTITINGVTQNLSANISYTVTGGVSGSGAVGQVAYWNGTTSITGESNLFWDSTNDRLGIGTTSPNRLLTVSGTQGLISFNATSYRNTTIGSDSVGNFIVYDDTAAAYRMVINSSGNVGIGTTSPANKLSIEGSTARIDINDGGGASKKAILIEPLGYSGNSYARIESYNYGTSTGGILALNATGGNVGIGTTSPAYKLDVVGAIRLSSGGVGGVLQFDYNSAVGSSRSWRLWNDVNANGDFVISQSTTQTGSTYTDRLYINSSGNVGIGTTSPVTKLHINGGLTGNGLFIQVNGASNTFLGNESSWLGSGTSTNTALISYNSLLLGTNDTERMRITSGGNVGIGTTSPQTKMDVRGGIQSIAASGSNFIAFGDYGADAGNFSIAAKSGRNMVITDDYAGVERMRITSGGNVLVGTTTDAGYKLDVNGTARINSSSASLTFYSSVFNRTGVIGLTDSANLFVTSPAGGNLYLGNNTTTFVTGALSVSSTVTATGFFNSSDNRLKDIISQDGDTIEFTWKDGRDNKKHIGYIAQEIQKTMPDSVNEGEDGMLSVNYIEVLVKKIQDLENRIKQLEK